MWNIGIGLRYTSPGRNSVRSTNSRALLVSPRWVSSAPFGNPVVPEVYWICAMSSGATAGSGWSAPNPDGSDPDGSARNRSHSVNSTTSRSAGRSGRTSSR